MTDGERAQAISRLQSWLRRECWLVTAAHGAHRSGLLATQVASVSIDPQSPVFLVGLARNHFTHDLALDSRAIGLHLLGRENIDLAWRFSLQSGRGVDKFAGLTAAPAPSGVPLLSGVLARMDCRVIETHTAGERTYFWCEPFNCEVFSGEPPLTDAELIASATADQRKVLAANMEQERDTQRPWLKEWLTHGRT
jgi:flavin reductase (DIM6/NTAB) family NADH-FMN oxidoreductase RutF